MKKLVIAACCMLTALATFAQGTVNFNNAAPINAPVTDVDGTTLLGPNSGALAALYGGPDANSLVFIGPAVGFRQTLSGNPNGFVNVGSAGARAIPGVALGGNAVVQVRAWKGGTGSTWETASIRGESNILTLKTGGDTPPGGTPNPPTNLTGLQAFSLVPEPSTIALGILGLAGLVIRRRK